MGKYGRPKLSDQERRTALTLNVRFNEREKQIVLQKARAIGITPTEWARFATLEIDPPERRIIPEINREAWLDLSQLATSFNDILQRVRPYEEFEFRALLEAIYQSLTCVRNQLIGNEQEEEI